MILLQNAFLLRGVCLGLHISSIDSSTQTFSGCDKCVRNSSFYRKTAQTVSYVQVPRQVVLIQRFWIFSVKPPEGCNYSISHSAIRLHDITHDAWTLIGTHGGQSSDFHQFIRGMHNYCNITINPKRQALMNVFIKMKASLNKSIWNSLTNLWSTTRAMSQRDEPPPSNCCLLKRPQSWGKW